MTRLKDDAQRLIAALAKLSQPPSETELLKLAKSVNVEPSRARHIARARQRTAEPKRELRGELKGEKIKHQQPKEPATHVPIYRQQKPAVES